jgi:antitoxin component of MazEF toxin-antitoxin module
MGRSKSVSVTLKADAGGAVTLPAELCREAGVAPGADLAAEAQNGRIVVESPRRPIWGRIAALAADASPEEIAKLPPGGSAEMDHYLYGTPKRSE